MPSLQIQKFHDTPFVFQHLLLSPEECLKALDQIYNLQNHWLQTCFKTILLPFYTLGLATYITFGKNYSEYLRYLSPIDYAQQAALINPIMHHHFNWLYQKVQTFFQDFFSFTVHTHPLLALSGFHIFTHSEAFLSNRSLPSIHFDLQYKEFILKKWDHVSIQETLSFTLALALPSVGSGLNVWPMTKEPWASLTLPEKQAWLKSHPPLYSPYTVGQIILQSGSYLHQMTMPPSSQSEERRITLQGHLIKIEDTYYMYW